MHRPSYPPYARTDPSARAGRWIRGAGLVDAMKLAKECCVCKKSRNTPWIICHMGNKIAIYHKSLESELAAFDRTFQRVHGGVCLQSRIDLFETEAKR